MEMKVASLTLKRNKKSKLILLVVYIITSCICFYTFTLVSVILGIILAVLAFISLIFQTLVFLCQPYKLYIKDNTLYRSSIMVPNGMIGDLNELYFCSYLDSDSISRNDNSKSQIIYPYSHARNKSYQLFIENFQNKKVRNEKQIEKITFRDLIDVLIVQ